MELAAPPGLSSAPAPNPSRKRWSPSDPKARAPTPGQVGWGQERVFRRVFLSGRETTGRKPLPQLQATSSSEVPARTEQGAGRGLRAGGRAQPAAATARSEPPGSPGARARRSAALARALLIPRHPRGPDRPLRPQPASLTQARRQCLFVGPHGPLDLPHGEDPAHTAAWSNSAAHSASPLGSARLLLRPRPEASSSELSL